MTHPDHFKLKHYEDELKKLRLQLKNLETDSDEREMELKKKISKLKTDLACKDMDIDNLKREIDELVGSINGRFADEIWSPINYLYKALPQQKLAALYKSSDVCLVTPLRDGMNLIGKEYASCKVDEDGVLILSEFAGAAEELQVINSPSVPLAKSATSTLLRLFPVPLASKVLFVTSKALAWISAPSKGLMSIFPEAISTSSISIMNP